MAQALGHVYFNVSKVKKDQENVPFILRSHNAPVCIITSRNAHFEKYTWPMDNPRLCYVVNFIYGFEFPKMDTKDGFGLHFIPRN